MSHLIRLLAKSFLVVGFLCSCSAFAVGDGDWTQQFPLKSGGFILHQPHQININNSMFVGNALNINGVTLWVNMKRRVFINTLLYSGMITLDDYVVSSK